MPNTLLFDSAELFWSFRVILELLLGRVIHKVSYTRITFWDS